MDGRKGERGIPRDREGNEGRESKARRITGGEERGRWWRRQTASACREPREREAIRSSRRTGSSSWGRGRGGARVSDEVMNEDDGSWRACALVRLGRARDCGEEGGSAGRRSVMWSQRGAAGDAGSGRARRTGEVGRERDVVERGRHARADLERLREPINSGRDGVRARAAARRERDLAVGDGKHERVELVVDPEVAVAVAVLAAGRPADVVGGRGRRLSVRPGRKVDDVLRDGGVRAGLVRRGVVLVDGEQGLVVKAVDPGLRVGLVALDRADVRRLEGGYRQRRSSSVTEAARRGARAGQRHDGPLRSRSRSGPRRRRPASAARRVSSSARQT